MLTKERVRQEIEKQVDKKFISTALDAFDQISDEGWSEYLNELSLYFGDVYSYSGWNNRIRNHLIHVGVDPSLADVLGYIRSAFKPEFHS